jgi:hypothetical protein
MVNRSPEQVKLANFSSTLTLSKRFIQGIEQFQRYFSLIPDW